MGIQERIKSHDEETHITPPCPATLPRRGYLRSPVLLRSGRTYQELSIYAHLQTGIQIQNFGRRQELMKSQMEIFVTRTIMAVPFSANCRPTEVFLQHPEEGDTKNE